MRPVLMLSHHASEIDLSWCHEKYPVISREHGRSVIVEPMPGGKRKRGSQTERDNPASNQTSCDSVCDNAKLEMWNLPYLYLISNRLGKDYKYVGTVTIK